jgi:Tfp pilus assembly protein PilF
VFLERAATALDDHAEAQHALGLALYEIGRGADAREALRRAVSLAPDEAPYLVALGRSCADDELYGEARTSLEKALRLDPSMAEAHAVLAVVCHKTGQRQAAMHHAREALSEQPDDETMAELLKLLEEDGSTPAG